MDDGSGHREKTPPRSSNRTSNAIVPRPVRKIVESPAFAKALKARAGENLAKAGKRRVQFRDPASTDIEESAESRGHDSSRNEGQVLAPNSPVAESRVDKSKEKKDDKLRESRGVGSSQREGRSETPTPKEPAVEFEALKSKQTDLSKEVEKLRDRRDLGSSQRQGRSGPPIPKEPAAEYETSKSKQKDPSEAVEVGKRHGRRDGSSKRKDPSWIPEWIEPDTKPDLSRPRTRFSSRIKEKSEKQELAERIEAWRKKFVGEWESSPGDGPYGGGACKRKRSESEERGGLDQELSDGEPAKRPKIVLRIAKEKEDSSYRVVSVSDGDESEDADESNATKLVETSEAAKPSKDGNERKDAGRVRSPERVPSTEQKLKRKEKEKGGTDDPRPEKLLLPKKSSSSCLSSSKPEEKRREASSAGNGQGRRHGQSKSNKSYTRPMTLGVAQKAPKTPMMTKRSSSGTRSSVTATKDKSRDSQAHNRSTQKPKSDLPRLSTALTKDPEKLLKTPPGKKNSVHEKCAALKTKDGRLDSVVNGVDQPRKSGVSRAILRKGAPGGPRSSNNSGSEKAVSAPGKGREPPSACSKDPVVDEAETQDGGRKCEKISDKVDSSSTCQADGKIAESIEAIAAGNSWFDFPTPEDYEKMKLMCEELIVENDDDGARPSSGDATDAGSPRKDDQREKQAQEAPASTLVEGFVVEKALTKAEEGDDLALTLTTSSPKAVTMPGIPNADDPSSSPASFILESPDFDGFREKLLEMLEKDQLDGFTLPAEPVVRKPLGESPTRASSSPLAMAVTERHETGDSRSSPVSDSPVQSVEPKPGEKARTGSVSSRVMEDLQTEASKSPPRASMSAEKPIIGVPFRKVQDNDQARSPLASSSVIMAMVEPDEKETFASIHRGDLPNVENQQEKLKQQVVAPELPAAISVETPVMDKPDKVTKKPDQLPTFPVSSPVAMTRAEKSDERQMAIPVVKAASCPTVPVEKPITAEPRSKLDKFLAQLKTPRPDKPRQTAKAWPSAGPYGINFPPVQQPPGPTPGEEWFSMDTILDDTFFCPGQYIEFNPFPTEPVPLMQIQLEPPFAPPTEGIRRGLLGDHPQPWAPPEAPKRHGLLGDHPNPEGFPLAVHQRPLVHYDDIPANPEKVSGHLGAPATSKKAAFSGDPESPFKEDAGFGGSQQLGLGHPNLRPKPSRKVDEKPASLGSSFDEKMLEGLSSDEIKDLDNLVLRELREERVFESSNDYVRSLLRYFWDKPVGKFDGASLTFSPTFQVPSSELTILFEEEPLKKKAADAAKKDDVQWWVKFTEIYEIPLRQRQMEMAQPGQQQSRRFGLRGRDRKREKEKEDFETMKETLGKAAVEDNKTLHFYENEFPNEPSPMYILKDELHEAIRKRQLLSSIYQNVYKLPSKPDANIGRTVADSSARK